MYTFFQSWYHTTNCSLENKILFREPTTFHVGADGQIHFTETRQNTKYNDFCVDLIIPDDYTFEQLEYDDYVYKVESFPGDECFLADSGEMGEMVAMFCDSNFIDVRKCCDTNEALNLRYLKFAYSHSTHISSVLYNKVILYNFILIYIYIYIYI